MQKLTVFFGRDVGVPGGGQSCDVPKRVRLLAIRDVTAFSFIRILLLGDVFVDHHLKMGKGAIRIVCFCPSPQHTFSSDRVCAVLIFPSLAVLSCP